MARASAILAPNQPSCSNALNWLLPSSPSRNPLETSVIVGRIQKPESRIQEDFGGSLVRPDGAAAARLGEILAWQIGKLMGDAELAVPSFSEEAGHQTRRRHHPLARWTGTLTLGARVPILTANHGCSWRVG